MARAAAWCEYWLAACLAGPASCAAAVAVVEVGLMRRVRMPVVAAVAVAGLGWVLLAGAGPVVAGVPSAGAGGWDKAIEVPGIAALNKGGAAAILSVSCAAAGGCAAGGQYRAFGHEQAFVVSEAGGRWRRAIEVPGTAALNKGGDAAIDSVSCAAAGSCAAGGFYIDGSGHTQAFVVSEAGGRWRTAIKVPGTAALNTGEVAQVRSVSCAAAGSCAAGGFYRVGPNREQAFVVSEAGGRWRTAIKVPGTAAVNTGGVAEVRSVSCAAAGGCAAGGDYLDGSGHAQAFVVTEAGGRWRTAIEVPGTAALNTGGNAAIESVSCAAAGSCAAGGFYRDGSGHQQAFVVSEADGRWRTAIEVPGTAALNTGGDAAINSVSCAAPHGCAAGGHYKDGSRHHQAFVVSKP